MQCQSCFGKPLLLNLAGVYDYMSIAAAEGQDSMKCMEEADGLVDLCIAQSYINLTSLIYIQPNHRFFELTANCCRLNAKYTHTSYT